MIYNNSIIRFCSKFLQISSILIISAVFAYSQDIHIVSNTDQWVASENLNGPWHRPVSLTDNRCHDPSNISSNCGSSYANPNNRIDNCASAEPIWGGNDPNDDCYWGQKTYYFKTTFYLSDIDSIEKIVGWIAVDNFFDIYLNGDKAGDQGYGSRRWSIDYDLTDRAHQQVNILPYLKSGTNEIIVAAKNTDGGPCYNFALFAFCLKIYLSGDNNNSGSSSENDCEGLDKWVVTPNPAQDLATLRSQCKNDEIWQVEVFDISGKRLLKTDESLDEYKINCSVLPSGIYIIRITYDSQDVIIKELVVTH